MLHSCFWAFQLKFECHLYRCRSLCVFLLMFSDAWLLLLLSCVCVFSLCCLFSLLFISTFVNCFDAVVIILRLSSVILCAYFHSFSLFYSHTDTQTDRVWQRNAWKERKKRGMHRLHKSKKREINKLYTLIYSSFRPFIYRYYCSFVPFRFTPVPFGLYMYHCYRYFLSIHQQNKTKQVNQN